MDFWIWSKKKIGIAQKCIKNITRFYEVIIGKRFMWCSLLKLGLQCWHLIKFSRAHPNNLGICGVSVCASFFPANNSIIHIKIIKIWMSSLERQLLFSFSVLSNCKIKLWTLFEETNREKKKHPKQSTMEQQKKCKEQSKCIVHSLRQCARVQNSWAGVTKINNYSNE